MSPTTIEREKKAIFSSTKTEGMLNIIICSLLKATIQQSNWQRNYRLQFLFQYDAISDTWHDPWMASLFIEEAEVVGIESHRDKFINWLIEGPSNRMVFSVVSIGGLGKTTLVKKVYNNDKVTIHFDCRAWIIVS